MPLTAREAALRALALFRKEKSTEKALADALDAIKEPREAALAARLFFSVLQNKDYLDFIIGQYCSVPTKKLQPQVLDIMRLAGSQMLLFDRIPSFSAVNEAVKSTRASAPKAAGLVNAVCRRISENRTSPPAPSGEKPECMAVKYSHPLWFVKRMSEILGEEDCEQYLQSNNTIPPVFLHANPLKSMHLESMDLPELKKYPMLPDCFEVQSLRSPEIKRILEEGQAYVQDPAAAMAVLVADPKRGMCVVDVCAAPGGKSFACAFRMENEGAIRAFDISAKKIPLIHEGAGRLGISILNAQTWDARQYRQELDGTADIVLADVPCSGLGVIRKKPEIRYKTAEEIAGLPEIQYQILKTASRYVKHGGTLVYSTCTVLPEENEEVLGRFLRETESFKAEDFLLPLGASRNGMITLYPHRNGTDGFFIGKLRRID